MHTYMYTALYYNTTKGVQSNVCHGVQSMETLMSAMKETQTQRPCHLEDLRTCVCETGCPRQLICSDLWVRVSLTVLS